VSYWKFLSAHAIFFFFFFFPLNTRPFPLPIPYSLSPLFYSKLSSIRAAYFHQRFPTWRSIVTPTASYLYNRSYYKAIDKGTYWFIQCFNVLFSCLTPHIVRSDRRLPPLGCPNFKPSPFKIVILLQDSFARQLLPLTAVGGDLNLSLWP
jgi:hypothetical protein